MRACSIAASLVVLAGMGGGALAAPGAQPLHVTKVADALRLCGPKPHAPGRYRCVGKRDPHDLERIEYVYQKISEANVKGGKTASDDWLAP